MRAGVRVRAAWAAALLAALSLGCGPGEVGPKEDAAAARALLAGTLDAWKAGRTPDDLRAADPVVYVADEDWSAGRPLAAYAIVGEPTPNGGHWRVFAEITVPPAKPGRRAAARKVCYAVSPGNPASVARSDYLD